MMRPETLKILLTIALYKEWDIRQWDVVAAYLQATLKHDIYVTDINEDGETEYWLLHKALYGLKQSGHEWYKLLSEILESAAYNRCIGDEGCFASKIDSGKDCKSIIGTHVDDMLGIGPSNMLDDIERGIGNSVELDKRGRPEKMLGMELTWNKEGTEVILTQYGLIDSLANTHRVSVTGARSSLPVDAECFKESRQNDPCDKKQFQQIIGSLLFIARRTRPDIAIHVNLLGRRASNLSTTHLQAAYRLLRFLELTRLDGIKLTKPRSLKVEIYADASYGGEESRSQSGAVMTLGGQVVGWSTRRQDIVALSITEAEYIADCEGAKDAAWVNQFLQEMKTQCEPTPILATDSEGAYNLSKTTKFLRRSRHIEHRFHYLRQQVQRDRLKIRTIPGKENPADILTKLLPMSIIKNWKMQWMGSAGAK